MKHLTEIQIDNARYAVSIALDLTARTQSLPLPDDLRDSLQFAREKLAEAKGYLKQLRPEPAASRIDDSPGSTRRAAPPLSGSTPGSGPATHQSASADTPRPSRKAIRRDTKKKGRP